MLTFELADCSNIGRTKCLTILAANSGVILSKLMSLMGGLISAVVERLLAALLVGSTLELSVKAVLVAKIVLLMPVSLAADFRRLLVVYGLQAF